MRLRRIEVRSFRKLEHAVIEDIGDGITVVVGDNEAGKSTLLAALRAALFDRHRLTGKAAEEMLPYGQRVRPEVALDFELDGKPWSLRKAFVQKPEAELVGPGERLTGDAVEERLAALFGFVPPGSGASKPEEHHGIHGLLWVEQGRAHEAPAMGGGRESIAAALEGEVGQMVGGERGRRLLAAAEKRRQAFWTPKTNAPRDVLVQLRREVEALQAEQADLASRLAEHDGKVSALAQRRQALERHRRERRLERAEEAVAAARAALAATADLRRTEETLVAELERARSDHALALEAATRREALKKAVEEAARAVDEARADAEAARSRLARQETGFAEAERQHREARARRDAAQSGLQRLQRAAERRRSATRLKALDAQREQAEAEERGRLAALAEAKACRIGSKDLEALDALERALAAAKARLDAASVRLTFAPTGKQRIRFDGGEIDLAEPLRLGRDAVLEIDGFGSVAVNPGGGAAERARAVEDAERQLAKALAELDIADVAGARDAVGRRLSAERRAEAHQRALSALAPQGLAALAVAAQAERAALAASGTAEEEQDASPESVEAAGRALSLSEEAERHAQATFEAQGAARQAADRDAARFGERLEAALRQHELRCKELAGERAQRTDGVIEAGVAKAREALAAAQARHGEAKRRLEEAEPEVAAQRLAMAERFSRETQADLDRLEREARDLGVELAALGHQGLGEALAEAEGRLEATQHRLAATELEARASRLLHDSLAAAQREAKERWLGPVRERVAPYLRLIHPGSEIVLDETTLALKGVRREGREEAFERLSVGAREQMAVIARLALADLLKASGHPAAVILDDALVNTDEGRLDRMHLVLDQAAKSLQILVLTCRERDFVGLGAPIRRL
jgi:chromosome segregation ATPase